MGHGIIFSNLRDDGRRFLPSEHDNILLACLT
jgi:hypothetical protein